MSALSAASMRFERKNLVPALVSAGLVLTVLFFVVFGQSLLGLDREGIDQFLASVRGEPSAVFAVIVLFSALALIGFPQAILFAGTVAVFGPVLGSLYAWGSTMVSSAMTFGLGRMSGARWTRRLPPGVLRDVTGVMQNRGVLASMIVRWTPSAPFIVVNAVCGASGMAMWRFMLGTGLGIVPKLLIIAFFTEQLEAAMTFMTSGEPGAIGLLVVAAMLWAAFILFCQQLYKRMKRSRLSALTMGSEETLRSGTTQEPVIKAKSSAL
ncbi:TVP38/TMEM64 family protein [Parvularcula maris]|uniref:TVP38/TMEM64 family membrane protein n=1 Tax=Parvularcula maris TaxID=2965077 RepID=A0A9X2RKF2_9PROT|nr:VTT domain-containing protein [Parvularcula maris]MCQ8185718.1 VTT domain-containing protein [Parvularcula maris]